MSRPASIWPGLLGWSAAHGLLAHLSMMLSHEAGFIAILWYANAPLAVRLTRLPRSAWALQLSGVAVTNALVNAMHGTGLPWGAPLALLNTAEILIGASLLQQALKGLASPAGPLSTGQATALLLQSPGRLFHALVACTALPGILVAPLAGWTLSTLSAEASLPRLALSWAEGSVIGALTLWPLMILAQGRGWRACLTPLQSRWRTATLLLLLAASIYIPIHWPYPFVYLSALLVLAAALGRFALTALAVALSATAMGATLTLGLFLLPPVDSAYGEVWFYLPMSLCFLPALALASALERNEAQHEQLRVREALYRSLYERTPVMMHSIDEAGRLVSVSRAWLDRLGYTEKEVLGLPSTRFLTEASRHHAQSVVIPLFIQQGWVKDAEYTMVTRQGEPVEVRLSAIWDQGTAGQRPRTLAVLIDVTQERRLADALRRERDRLDAFLSGTQVGTWAWHPGLQRLEVDRNWRRLGGLPDEHATSARQWWRQIHPQDRRRVATHWRDFLQGRRLNIDCEFRIRHPEAGWLHVLDRSGSLLPDCEHGDGPSVVGTRQDVSSLKLALEQVRASERRLQKAQEVAALGAFTLERNGPRFHPSLQWLRIMGLPEAPPNREQPWLWGLGPQDRAWLEGHIQRTWSEGTGWDLELKLQETPPRWIRHVAEVERDGGLPVRLVGAIQDITAQRMLSQEQQGRLRAEAQSAAKSAFLAHMSHEVRTPMNGVIGLLQLVTPHLADDEGHRLRGMAEQSARNLLELLNELLDHARLDAAALALQVAPFDPQALADALCVQLMGQWRRPEVLWVMDIPRPLPPRLMGDRLRVQQILSNLVSNAIKFTEKGWIRVRWTYQLQDDGHAELDVSVHDSGPGISAEDAQRLFTVFGQGQSGLSQTQGSGLGLALSKRLVELMGGQLYWRSEPGVGSLFGIRVSLPIAPAPVDALPAPERLGWQLADLPALLAETLQEGLEGHRQTVLRLGGSHMQDPPLHPLSRPKRDDLRWIDVVHGPVPPAALASASSRSDLTVCLMTPSALAQVAAPPCPASSTPSGSRILRLPLPVTPSQLQREVLRCLADPEPRPTHERPVGLPLAGVHILVIEDQALNREVARGLLSTLGARVDLVPDGEQGLARVQDGGERPDVVLADWQMPGLDGLAVCRLMSQMDDPPKHRILLTAQDERDLPPQPEGVTAILSKPLDTRRLMALLGRLPAETSVQDDTLPVSASHLPSAARLAPWRQPALLLQWAQDMSALLANLGESTPPGSPSWRKAVHALRGICLNMHVDACLAALEVPAWPQTATAVPAWSARMRDLVNRHLATNGLEAAGPASPRLPSAPAAAWPHPDVAWPGQSSSRQPASQELAFALDGADADGAQGPTWQQALMHALHQQDMLALGLWERAPAAVRAQWESTPQWQALASDITALRFQEALATLSGLRLEQSPGAQPKSA